MSDEMHPKIAKRRNSIATTKDVARRHPDWITPQTPQASDAGCCCRWLPPIFGWPGRWDRLGCPVHTVRPS